MNCNVYEHELYLARYHRVELKKQNECLIIYLYLVSRCIVFTFLFRLVFNTVGY